MVSFSVYQSFFVQKQLSRSMPVYSALNRYIPVFCEVIENKESPAGDIKRTCAQSFIHGDGSRAVTSDADLVAQCLVKCLAKNDADVLY